MLQCKVGLHACFFFEYPVGYMGIYHVTWFIVNSRY